MFTCTASNKYGTVSSSATLKVKGKMVHFTKTSTAIIAFVIIAPCLCLCVSAGNGNNNHARSFTSVMVEPSQIQEATPSAPTVNPQLEVTVTNSIKPHSSTIRLDPLISSSVRLDPLSTSTLRLDPLSSSMLRPDHLRSSLPSLEPSSLSSGPCLSSLSTSTPNLDPVSLHQSHAGPIGLHPEPQSSGLLLSYPRPYISPAEQKVSRPSVTSPNTSSEAKKTSNHQNESPIVVPLPDPPPNSCLKTGSLTNHKDSRSSNRVGLRVHFKLPEDEYEDEKSEASSQSDEDGAQMSINKEPPPVRAKPKL